MQTYNNFHIIIRQEEDLFVSKVLENDVSSFGSTFQEAFDHTREALDLYYEDETNSMLDVVKIHHPSLISYQCEYA